MWRNAASWSAALVAAVLTVAPPADARTLDEIIKAGVVRIGVTANLPPQSSLNTQNQMEGMDIDFGNLIATALGVKAEFIIQEEPARVPNLVADVTDISLGGLTRNHRRAILIDYTLPTFTESQVVLTTEKHKEKKTWGDFNRPDITLVSVRSTTPAEWTRENAKNAKELLVESGADMIRAIA